jgi:hypothetical protein
MSRSRGANNRNAKRNRSRRIPIGGESASDCPGVLYVRGFDKYTIFATMPAINTTAPINALYSRCFQ